MMESKLSDTPNAREATSKVFKTAAPGSAGTDEVCGGGAVISHSLRGPGTGL
jgi:hypothetical protein